MAIEIVDLSIKMVIFHSYVKLPEGIWNMKTLWKHDENHWNSMVIPVYVFVYVFANCQALSLRHGWSCP